MSPIVGTPITPVTEYATVAELKVRIGIGDATDDAVLLAVLKAVSRGIDNYCARFFYQTAAATVRYYTPRNGNAVLIDDCVSLSAVQTDANGDRTYEQTWATTDYDLEPDNAGAEGRPYWKIAQTPNGSYCFPVGLRKGLKLTGVWGWPETPAPVKEACLIQAARVFKRKDSPFGIAGSPDVGMLRIGRLDPDVLWMLDAYRHLTVG
jgi:hypothetical protein